VPPLPASAAPGQVVSAVEGVRSRVTIWLSGRVQGVGMRWWVRARALELGLAGHAANLADGRVEIVAEGPPTACSALLELLREQPSAHGRPGHVSSVTCRDGEVRGLPAGFVER
jgi:acylphosphatase